MGNVQFISLYRTTAQQRLEGAGSENAPVAQTALPLWATCAKVQLSSWEKVFSCVQSEPLVSKKKNRFIGKDE